MTIFNHKPSDMRLDADTRSNLMGLRAIVKRDRKGLRLIKNPEIRRILRKEITVTQYDIRAIGRRRKARL